MLKEFKNILFGSKHICLICKEKDTTNSCYICKDCYENLEILNKEIDMDSPYINNVYYSLSYNRFLRDTISDYKFNGKNYLYKPFGEIMVETVMEREIDKDLDLILYVPSHRRKEALRGYNQAELLASYISTSLNKPLSKKNLIKIRWTKEQSALNKLDRMINLKDSFHIKSPEEIDGKKILLIDDIITTGVTMEECSRVLLKNGVKEVIGLALTSSKIQ